MHDTDSKKSYNPRLRNIIFFAAIIMMTSGGCSIGDDMSDCEYLSLRLRVIDSNGHIIDSGLIDTLDVYLFNKNGFVRKIEMGEDESFYLVGFEKNDSITVVAWGNLKRDSLEVPEISTMTSLDNARIGLKKKGLYSMDLPDLFYSRFTLLEKADTNQVNTRLGEVLLDTVSLEMRRVVTAVTITGKHIAERYGADTSGYYFIVRGTKDAINFNGELYGTESAYAPPVSFDSKGNLVTPVFRIFPVEDEEYITVDLYHGNDKLFSVNVDNNGNPFRSEAGTQLNIIIDFFSENADVKIVITPWGETWQETSM